MNRLRATAILVAFMAFTLPLMPLQAVFLAIKAPQRRSFPNWYHRQVCRLLGVRLIIDGEVERGRPVLIVANHVSWLDIPVLSAVAPVSFIAKREVASWPFVSWLAKLQRSVFVDRQRPGRVAQTSNEIVARLKQGDKIVFFAEGTSNDGNRVLPFRSSLFAAVRPSKSVDADDLDADVQTLSLCYTRLCGLPANRQHRPVIAWYGNMPMASHAWRLLGTGPIVARIRIGEPVPLDSFADRKALAQATEADVRQSVAQTLYGSDQTK